MNESEHLSLIDRFVVQLSQVFMLRVFPVGTPIAKSIRAAEAAVNKWYQQEKLAA